MNDLNFWLENLWLPILVGLLIAAIVGVFSEEFRRKALRPLWRGARWLTTIRLTTTGKVARERARNRGELTRLQGELDRLRADAHDEAERHSVQLGARKDEVTTAAAAARKEGHADGVAAGRAEAWTEVAAQRAALTKQPVWRVLERPGGFELRDAQKAGVLRNVAVSVLEDTYEFHGPTQTTGPFFDVMLVSGQRTRHGRLLGVEFVVTWQDENGDHQAGNARLDREDRQGWVMG